MDDNTLVPTMACQIASSCCQLDTLTGFYVTRVQHSVNLPPTLRQPLICRSLCCRIGKVFSWLGLTVAAVAVEDRLSGGVAMRREKFGADITYVTGQELAFTWMADNTSNCRRPDQQVLKYFLRQEPMPQDSRRRCHVWVRMCGHMPKQPSSGCPTTPAAAGSPTSRCRGATI